MAAAPGDGGPLPRRLARPAPLRVVAGGPDDRAVRRPGRQRPRRRIINAPLPGALGPDGWLTRGSLGALEWARGKHKGHRVTRDLGYTRWVCGLPRLPSGIDGETWCSAETAALLGA